MTDRAVASPAFRELVPAWWRALSVGLFAVLAPFFTLVAVFMPGPAGWAMRLLALGTWAMLVATAVAALAPRRSRTPAARADGTVVITSPASIVVGLLVAWAAALGFAVVTVWIALTDFSALESPGMSLLAVLGAVGTVPDLVRLARGRLHRWRLVIAGDGVTYRGYRTDVDIPWDKLHGAALVRRGSSSGVRLDRKGAGADPVLPLLAFTVAPEQIVEAVETGLTRARATGRRAR